MATSDGGTQGGGVRRAVASGRWLVLACMFSRADHRPSFGLRRIRTAIGCVSLVALLVVQSSPAGAQSAEGVMLPLVSEAGTIPTGLVRVANLSARAGTVRVQGVDDEGRSSRVATLALDAEAAVQLSSHDLERGNAGKGLPAGIGDGTGRWRVHLASELDVAASAYIRMPDGFLTGMSGVVPAAQDGANRWRVSWFNPASNTTKSSRLRLVNPGDATATVTIRGRDDTGRDAPGGTVRVALAPKTARTVTSQQLEPGAPGLTGRLGDGSGKWTLEIEADRPVVVMNLLRASTGHLSNLSDEQAVPSDHGTPDDQAEFDALVVGKWMISPPTSPDIYHMDFVSPGRFKELEGSDVWTGRYTYQKAGADTGRIEFNYDDGDRCTAVFQFETPTTGIAASACNDGDTSAGSWQLVDVPAPDLVVVSPSVSDSSPSAGQSFTLRATVRNQGRAGSAATTLRWYRSSDATVSTTDTQIGTDAVDGLAASGASPESIRARAPSSPGTYYYGACVDSVSGESSTANNCSGAVSVSVSSGGGDGSCTAGLVVNPGESCTYKGYDFSVNSSGRGSIAFFGAGSSIDARGSTINGVLWNFRASRNSGSTSWTIHQAD